MTVSTAQQEGSTLCIPRSTPVKLLGNFLTPHSSILLAVPIQFLRPPTQTMPSQRLHTLAPHIRSCTFALSQVCPILHYPSKQSAISKKRNHGTTLRIFVYLEHQTQTKSRSAPSLRSSQSPRSSLLSGWTAELRAALCQLPRRHSNRLAETFYCPRRTSSLQSHTRRQSLTCHVAWPPTGNLKCFRRPLLYSPLHLCSGRSVLGALEAHVRRSADLARFTPPP